VVGHQAIDVAQPIETLEHLTEDGEKAPLIFAVPIDRLSRIPLDVTG
jgi:hypothetical protein